MKRNRRPILIADHELTQAECCEIESEQRAKQFNRDLEESIKQNRHRSIKERPYFSGETITIGKRFPGD